MKNKIVGIFVCMLLIIGGISVTATSINYNDNTVPDSINTECPSDNPPVSFDLRNVNGKNYVTAVKDQIFSGPCWAFAVMASMESNLLITGNWEHAGEEGEPDLSESHMDWWNGFMRFNNDDGFGNTGLSDHNGGDCRMATAYLSRGDGAVRERDAPYIDKNSNIPEITNPNYHYYYVNDIESYDIGEDLRNMNLIKNTIMTDGAISINYCPYIPIGKGNLWLPFNFFLNEEDYTFYQPPTSIGGISHAVAIIGWDDNKVTAAPEKGAWLCKNSHGSNWGLDGYFWISYYDKWCCHYHPTAWTASFQGVEPMPYNQVYYHDYHGWEDTLNGCTEAFNAFYSTSNNTLRAVSFFTATDNVEYTIRIYENFDINDLTAVLSNISGTIPLMGFHTVVLPQPVYLQPDDYFYIYLYLSNGGQPYDRTLEANEWCEYVRVESVSHPGESYHYNNGAWCDLYYVDMSANFCIKGLATRDVPNLNVTITPGSGRDITVIVTNNGLEDANKVPWKITVSNNAPWKYSLGSGIFGMIRERITGTIDIPAGESKTISMVAFLGFGGITINAMVDIYSVTVTRKQLLLSSITQ